MHVLCYSIVLYSTTTTYSIYQGTTDTVSVSADMKKLISVFYWYRPIRKLYLSAFIGIGRYEKRLIGRPLAAGNLNLNMV